MANDIFVDTSGFYAMLVKTDDKHLAVAAVLAEARRRHRKFVTTEHVLDETATLVKMRGFVRLLPEFFERFHDSSAFRIEWTDPDRFFKAWKFFLKRADQEWSFTDCLSFHAMTELRLRDVLSKDAHFAHAGFAPLLL
jgi:predicted nucleic acid-binding protein